ncbi:hypothetical protein CR194_07595 [Salipaludibacillus keqinensis]|uniref:DUF4363 domain-containing protein n=1 Tax=Salipaludibacillus keqinensis TaxID=2045207 RepID=A0A323TKA1_9BACI|nr:DUF4363 family protein [Salipaludibacillus keqinensis]PYZ93053.1 hypothetical protein CR194_07595 [Salipaludibacillus keqinensis]
MKKFFIYFVPILFVASSFIIMTSGSWLKEPFRSDDDLAAYVENIESNVREENWEDANKEYNRARKAWELIKIRIQYSVEREDIVAINEALFRVEGGIEAHDSQAILSEIYYFYGLWREVG